MWALIASLSSAIVLFSASLLVWLLNARHVARAEARARQQQAYADLLVAAIGVPARVYTMLSTLNSRSGILEGVSIALWQRKPLDPLALHDWLNKDLAALMDAWTRVWVHGSTEGIRLGNHIVDHCGSLMDLVTSDAKAAPPQRIRQMILGFDNAHLLSEWERHMRTLSAARRDLVDYMRAETGRPAANLFSEV